MATLTGLIPVTVGTVEAYHGGGGGGDTIGGGGGAGNAERRTIYIYIYILLSGLAVGSSSRFWSQA